jgi:hypothetical protein
MQEQGNKHIHDIAHVREWLLIGIDLEGTLQPRREVIELIWIVQRFFGASLGSWVWVAFDPVHPETRAMIASASSGRI